MLFLFASPHLNLSFIVLVARYFIHDVFFFKFRLCKYSSIFPNFLPVIATTNIYRILVLFFVKNACEKMQEVEQAVRALHTGLDSSEIVKTLFI